MKYSMPIVWYNLMVAPNMPSGGGTIYHTLPSKNMALITPKRVASPPTLIIRTDFTHWQVGSRHNIITAVLRANLIVHDCDLVAVSLSEPSPCQ